MSGGDEAQDVIRKAMSGNLSKREFIMIGLADDTKQAIKRIIELSPVLEDSILNVAELCYRDGSVSDLTSEQMIHLLITPITDPDPDEIPSCIVCHKQHEPRDYITIGRGPNSTTMVAGHEYVIVTKTTLQKYPRRWRMGFLGGNERELQFSARGPDRTHGSQYGGTQHIPTSTIITAREVEANHARRYVGTPVRG